MPSGKSRHANLTELVWKDTRTYARWLCEQHASFICHYHLEPLQPWHDNDNNHVEGEHTFPLGITPRRRREYQNHLSTKVPCPNTARTEATYGASTRNDRHLRFHLNEDLQKTSNESRHHCPNFVTIILHILLTAKTAPFKENDVRGHQGCSPSVICPAETTATYDDCGRGGYPIKTVRANLRP